MGVASGSGLALAAIALVTAAGCGSSDDGRRAAPRRVAPLTTVCPARLPAPSPLPGVRPEQRTLAYWLERASRLGGIDEVLLSADQIEAHNRALEAPRDDGKALAWVDLTSPVERDALRAELTERLGYLRERAASGEYVDPSGRRLDARQLGLLALPEPLPEVAPRLHVALTFVPFRCGPRREGLYRLPVDATFNRNACGSVHAQEPILVLARWPGGATLARARHSFGWIDGSALSPPVPLPISS